MTTWYVDYEGGTNANASAGNGDSFATRRKTIDNCVAAAIAPGDTIRVMGSPAPTSVGSGTWTDGPLPATISITSSTNATPIVLTTATNTYATGDTVIVTGHTTNTNANGVWKVGTVTSTTVQLLNADGSNSVGNGVGSSGTIRKFTNAVVTLATACTQNIALCGNRGAKTNWTASANVTCSIITSDYKEGGECLEIAIAAGFTTGLAAYYTLPSSTDYSAFQQISNWIKQTAGTIGAAGAVSIALCSDTAGATPVDTATIPALGALSQWVPAVYDKAAALGSTIQSIAFYVNTDNGAQTFRIDNIIACKAASSADSLNLSSLISKDPGDHSYGDGYECWFGIQSINSTRVVLDGTVNSIPGSSPQRGYSGTTETVTTYKRETIKTVALASNTGAQTPKDSGTAGNPITFSGGWNRTDMSTQTLETWFDGQNGLGYGLYPPGSGVSYLYIDKINHTRYYTGINSDTSNAGIAFGKHEACNCSSLPISMGATGITATTLSAVCCGGAITPGTAAVVTTIGRADSTTSGNGVTLGAGSWTGTIKSANNNASNGLQSGIASYIGSITAANGNASAGLAQLPHSVVGSLTANTNGTYGVTTQYQCRIDSGSTSGNASGGFSAGAAKSYLRNFTIGEATEVAGFTVYNDGRVYSEKHDGTAGNNRIFCDGGLIATDATVTHGSASYSWKFSPTSTNRSEYYPLNQAIAQIAVGASALVTVKAWLRRDNTGITGRLVCKGGQLAGVASDVVSSMTVAANTWEELTITFTPTEAGVIEVEAQFYGGTSYNGWCSDMTIGQA